MKTHVNVMHLPRKNDDSAYIESDSLCPQPNKPVYVCNDAAQLPKKESGCSLTNSN